MWINIFVLDMVQFISDHLRLLEKWENTFLDSVEGASKRKLAEIDVLMKRIKKSLASQEEMANKVRARGRRNVDKLLWCSGSGRVPRRR